MGWWWRLVVRNEHLKAPAPAVPQVDEAKPQQ
jgi:hypothetical protein